MKVTLFTILLLIIFLPLIIAQTNQEKVINFPLDYSGLTTAVPLGNFTPHGYLDNPYHSMIFNRSGVIRSLPPLGMGYWKKQFWGSYGEGPQGHVNYLSLLQFSVTIDQDHFIGSEDFIRQKVELFSRYHTKNVMSYDWSLRDLIFSVKYFLPRENTLACLLEIENNSDETREIVVNATNIYGLWESKWWGSNGLSSQYLKKINGMISKIWAYGDVFILASDWTSQAHTAAVSEQDWKEWLQQPTLISSGESFLKGEGPIYSVLSYKIILSPHSKQSGFFYLCRGKNEQWTLEELTTARREASAALKIKLQDDNEFWSKCPQLQGDWPESWKHGWVYDWETLRMNIRQPIGIFKHPWDAMQVHSPRLVLGETALDMWTFSYADPELAKEVIFGTFADAIMPNVPCVREDGSVNMIGADGSECGTAPMWGFPFHVIRTIYLSTADTNWVYQLYAYLKTYVEWWLQHRTDNEGWFHCNNSWESGQDGSRRFLVKGEGDPATFVRTVDVEASMAEAMQILTEITALMGYEEDRQYWEKLSVQRLQNTRSMFQQGWFRDIDGRNNQPIVFEDFYDPIMLAPLTCGIATADQIEAIRPKLKFIVENPRWLQWPPAVQAFTEAAWNAGLPLLAAQAVVDIAQRIYQRTDSSSVMYVKADEPFSYRIPGVANEFWPVGKRPPGGENYGWGATLPAHIIRSIIGFRESEDLNSMEFYLTPAIPPQLNVPGKEYKIIRLHYRGVDLNFTYQIQKNKILVKIDYLSQVSLSTVVKDVNKRHLTKTDEAKKMGQLLFSAENGHKYLIVFNK
jgi:hypothetical protein